MKTIQELYDEIMASPELKVQFIEAAQAGKQEAFWKEHGCEATQEEVAAFLKAKNEADAPLSIDELESSAGGVCNDQTSTEVIMSIFSAGTACALRAMQSALDGQIGQTKETKGRLCSLNY